MKQQGGRQGKDRKQQVDVYFNFIGNCQVPQKVDIEKRFKNGKIYNRFKVRYISWED